MTERRWKVAFLFTLLFFFTLAGTFLLAAALLAVVVRTGAVSRGSYTMLVAGAAAVSTLAGMGLSRFISRKPLDNIAQISRAAQEVARGHFDVRLSEETRIEELRDLAHSFNIMTRELAGTELLRTDFVENVSHEFKTPLSAIEGYATLLQKPGLSADKREEYTRKILLNTRRLSKLTTNILLLSRLEKQEIGVQREPFSLDEQLRETILLLEAQWTAKKLELEIELETADCLGSRDLLAHVWQNLLGNAVKYAPEGGRVRVALRREADALSVEIEDNGPGISPEVQRRMFEKFYQGDGSRSSEGNGLGLALARRIVDLHGGTIRAASEPGGGALFTVRLPQ